MNVEKEKSQPVSQNGYVFALDIGTRTVVGIIGEYIDEKFYLKDYVSVPHNKRAMVDGQVEDIKQVSKIVAIVKSTLEERNNIRLERVSIAAAGRALKTISTGMSFDVSGKEYITEEMVKSMEVETIQKAQTELDESPTRGTTFYCVGHSITSYMLDDYKMISLEGHKGEKAEVNLIAAFLPSIVVEGLYAVMDINNLEVASLTLEPIAAMNVIVPPEIRLINIALVDIGAGTSDIAVSKDGSVYAYAMATIAGDEITEEIIKTYLVDFNTAEDLKQNCSDSDEELEFRDILGVSHKLKASEIYQKVMPAVDVLADTICKAITDVNGGSPAAVFLVGGGSLIEGLPALVAEKLNLEESRVAIGGGDFLKNVDEQGAKLGAEFVTPVGIAVTTALEQGYDFSVIFVNDKKVRAFDTKQLTVFEALNLAGYKSSDIMGRSGRNLTYTLNGKRTVIKGGSFSASEVYINEHPASVTSKITQGDHIRFTPATSGENAKATLADAINYSRFNTGTVEFGGQKHKLGLRVSVNGVLQEKDYEIQPLDNIETTGIVTLGDLLQSLDIEMDGIEYLVNDQAADESYILSDGDMISYDDGVSAVSEPVTEKKEEKPEDEKPIVAEEPVAEEIPEPAVEEKASEIQTPAAETTPTMPEIKAPVIEEKPVAAETPVFVQSEPVQKPVFTAPPQPFTRPSGVQTPTYSAPIGMSVPPQQPKQEPVNPIHASFMQRGFSQPANLTFEEAPAAPAPMPVNNAGDLHVQLNGANITLAPSPSGHMLLDLLNFIDIDPTAPNTELILEINGAPANFSSLLEEGDRAVIRLQERR